MDIKQELKEIRIQMSSDFDFTALALASAMNELARRMEAMGREMEERFQQVEGRTRLQEQRFNRMLDAVEGALDDWKPEIIPTGTTTMSFYG